MGNKKKDQNRVFVSMFEQEGKCEPIFVGAFDEGFDKFLQQTDRKQKVRDKITNCFNEILSECNFDYAMWKK